METKQVKFIDTEGEEQGGILVDNKYIICGCCGGVFEVDEVHYSPLPWVNISKEIIGD